MYILKKYVTLKDFKVAVGFFFSYKKRYIAKNEAETNS